VRNKILCAVSFLLFLIIGIGAFATPVSADAAVVKLGDQLTIGKWEQNGNSDDGAEPITWRVVYMTKGKAILLADNILDMAAYSNSDATWSSSSLRSWLNGTFYNTAFTDSEKNFIDRKRLLTRVADKMGFEKTDDYIYVLSDTEAKGYAENITESAKPTAYTSKKGLFVDDKGYGYWWLRAPGSDTTHSAYVNPDGSLYVAGCKVSYANMGGVRPAMQIDLNKSGFGGNTLTVNYLYSNGTVAGKSYFAGITSGEKYDIKSPEIKGCVPDKTSVSGTMGTEDITITVTYKSTAKKERKIAAPVVEYCDKGKVVLQPVNPNGYGYLRYGYSLKNDINTVSAWVEEREFPGLVGGTTYYFFARVTGSTVYVDAFSAGTAVRVDKTDRTIDAPQILNFNHNAVAGLEVSSNGGGSVTYGVSASDVPGTVKNWSKYPVFNGLSSGVKYYLFAKVSETDNFKEAYSCTEFTTTATKTGTEIPVIKNVTENSIEVIPVDMLIGKVQYGISSTADVSGVGEWTSGTLFSGLEKGKRYYIFTKVENNSMYTNEVCSYSSAVTVSATRNAVIAEIESVVGVTVTVKPVIVGGSDFVYFGISLADDANNVSAWQMANVFDDLLPDTDYYIFTKLSNGNAAEDIISSGVHIRTEALSDGDPEGNVPSADSDDKDGLSAWWIILMIIAIVALIGSGAYILIKKKIIFKSFKGFGKIKVFVKVKDIFYTAFKPLKKNDSPDDIYDDIEMYDQGDSE